MSYDATVAVPVLLSQTIAGPKIWIYRSTDDAATVDGSGYFTDGYNRGMREGDLILVTDTDASPPITTSHLVRNSAGTTINLTDGVTLGTTVGD